jgi:hypothetical protein
MSSFWRHIRHRQTGNSQLDKKIEREVNSLSFVIGCLIALAFRVDLFRMFAVEDPRTVLLWNEELSYDGLQIFLFFISIPLTGFFLTFGSKFFHDLIDTLLQVKNLKRKLVDEETFKVDTVEQLDEFLHKSFTDIIRLAIEQNRQVLQTPDMTSPPMQGKMFRDGLLTDCIDIHVAGDSRGNLPPFVSAQLDKGKTVRVIVNVITDVEMAAVEVEQGDKAANHATATFRGTLACRVNKGGVDYLLTCSHVLTGGTNQNFAGALTPRPADIEGQEDGSFQWAICTDTMDIALLQPNSQQFTYAIPPGIERRVLPTENGKTKIKVVCRDGVKRGVVINSSLSEPLPVKYKNITHGLTGLMVLSNISDSNGQRQFAQVTVKGDSGALVYDDSDRPVGMIVAGNNRFSYAIPIVDILNHLTATITT